MKYIKSQVALLLVFALCLTMAPAALAAADDPGWTTALDQSASLSWNEDHETLAVAWTGAEFGGYYFLRVMPAVIAEDGTASAYSTDLTEAVYVDQVTAESEDIVFDAVYPTAWEDCVLLLTGTGLSGAVVLGTVCTSFEQPEAELVSVTFSDVPDTAWYYTAVSYAAGMELVVGYEDGTYCPTDNMTIAQYLTVMYRYAYDATETLLEKQTTGESWMEAAAYLNEGLSLDFEDLTVAMTRYDMAYITAEVLQIVSQLSGVSWEVRETHGFSDVASEDGYFDYVTYLESVYGVDGYDEDGDGVYEFRGENDISRCEVAQVVYNILTELAG